MRFEGKTFFITGGARGQGRAIALKAAADGARVALLDVAKDVPTVPYTLGTEDDLAATRRLVEDLGSASVDVFCAGAGVHSFIPFWKMTDQEWSTILDINLTGLWHGAKAVAPQMLGSRAGRSSSRRP